MPSVSGDPRNTIHEHILKMYTLYQYRSGDWWHSRINLYGSFWVCTQPMRGDATLWHSLSLAEPISRNDPWIYPWSSNDNIRQRSRQCADRVYSNETEKLTCQSHLTILFTPEKTYILYRRAWLVLIRYAFCLTLGTSRCRSMSSQIQMQAVLWCVIVAW